MIQTSLPQSRPVARQKNRPLQWLRSLKKPESVYFFTLHKCASTLFSQYVLKNAIGLKHIDPGKIQNLSGDLSEITFSRRGVVYGPLRLSVSGNDEMVRHIVGPLTSPKFLRDCQAVVMIRDPRDIVVSAYYSFGFSHSFSPNAKLRALQKEKRAFYQSQGIDEVAKQIAPHWRTEYQKVETVVAHCPRCVLLTYEEMIDGWETFRGKLCHHLSFSEQTLREIYARSRPRDQEDVTAHQRSGKTGGFREKLRPETVEALNEIFASILDRFGYKR